MLEPKLTENAAAVLAKRYLVKDQKGRVVETPKQLFLRVARAIAAVDRNPPTATASYRTFYDMMARLDFLPNTPCLINAGRENGQGQFSACFVLPVEDNMRSIGKTMVDMMMIHKSGGGTGFDFSALRPHGDFVKSTTGIASGPVSFMRMYNNVTEEIKQSGARRGANMGILRVDHPDIMRFIRCKADVSQIQNFNISVGITDAFVAALDHDADYALVNPRTGETTGRLFAREVWEAIVEQAHATGEPGLFFVDRANAADPLAHLPEHRIRATNPCGEVPLSPYNACTLGSINLGNFVTAKREVDWGRLSATVRDAVHFLDNVLDANSYPVPEIAETVAAHRKIGLGVMGWADMLVRLRIPYASEEALEHARKVMQFINHKAVNASQRLAEERGPFPLWEQSRWAKYGKPPRRNSTVTVIAPTGSISLIAGCSAGVEPLFALSQTRRQADMVMTDLSPVFEEWLEAHTPPGGQRNRIISVVKEHGYLRSDELRNVMGNDGFSLFAIANEIDVKWHVKMQAAFQAHVEDAVSKTINLPNSATVEDVDTAYRLAWNEGCKGITVYRDGCRPMQTLSVGTGKKDELKEAALERLAEITRERRRIPDDGEREGVTITKKTAYGSVHVTINEHPDDGLPFELFCALGKGGSESAAWAEAVGRTISLLLSTAADPLARLGDLVEQLTGIGGGQSHGMGEARIASAADGVARCVREYMVGRKFQEAVAVVAEALDICPDCGQAALGKNGGCDLCSSCGYTKC